MAHRQARHRSPAGLAPKDSEAGVFDWRWPHHQADPHGGDGRAQQGDRGDLLVKQDPGNQGRGRWHQVHQAGHGGRSTALDQQVEQRRAPQREPQHRPGHRTCELAVPLHSLGLQGHQGQGDHGGRHELHRVGSAHIAGLHKTLLVERARGDGQQGHHGPSHVLRCHMVQRRALGEFARHHHHQPGKTQQQPQPLAARHAVLALARSHGGQPNRCEHRLDAHDERGQTRAHARLDGSPYAAQVARVHEHTGHGQVQRLRALTRPGHAGQHDPRQKAKDGEKVAPEQEGERRRMRHAVARHDEAGAPDQHEHGGHGTDPGRGLLGVTHFTRARISGKAFCM